ICFYADGVVCMNEEGWAIEGTTPMNRLADLFRELAKIGLAGLIDKKAAQRFYAELRHDHEQHSHLWQDLQTDSQQDNYLEEPVLKNLALYVYLDVTSGKVTFPDQLDEDHLRKSFIGLDYFLKEYATLPTVVGDNQHWHDFASRVRKGLSDTDTH